MKTLKQWLHSFPDEMEIGLARDEEINGVHKIFEVVHMGTEEGKDIAVIVPIDEEYEVV